MTAIIETDNCIRLENRYAEIVLSREGAVIEAVIDKAAGQDIKAAKGIPLFILETKEEETIPIRTVSLCDNLLTVETANGAFDLAVTAAEHYFTFEVLTSLPEGTFRAYIANARYDYDPADKSDIGAVGIAMTVSVDPMEFPDAKSRKTGGRIYPHLADKGAKYALILAPICEQRDIIKEVCLAIDRNRGICSTTGGAWGRDSRLNFSNYTIQSESSREFIEANIPFFKSIGVDQIDLHQGGGTFRQGDFRFMRYENAAEFRKNVSDVLAQHGMTAGLHTYSHYIAYHCDTILSNPDDQAQLKVMETFTLAEDIGEDAGFIPTVESTEAVSDDFGFCRTNTPFVLIDNEIIEFKNHPHGFTVARRGCAGTKAVPHSAGAAVRHLEGHYHGFTPVLGSELFYRIARNTAKTFNEGGFRMIYLDALDGIGQHCDAPNECWYYTAAFVCEVLRYCETDPVLEGSTYMPSMWAARGRIGAWDTPYRGYKEWNNQHAASNRDFIDRYGTPILGWYDFYPMTDQYPGNEHTRYHHTDSIEHMGSLAVMYDFPNVFNGTSQGALNRYAGMRRNIGLYKKYDDLRKAQYFSEEYRQKLIDGAYEYHLKEKRGGRFVFEEKDYQTAKLFDLNDPERNTGDFRNPFGAQMPFLRIEAMLSTAYRNPVVLLPLDESRELVSQPLSCNYGGELNLSEHLAKTVRVFGNGIAGGKIAVKLRCATNSESGYGEYIIDTDFHGWREFILIESDNGERTDHGFEKNEGRYAIFRSSLNNDRITAVSVETEGDMTGVRMSSILAYEHTYEILKNPTVTIGNTSILFECELMSSDFIEFDGKTAKVIDRYGNEKPVWFTASEGFRVPRGKFRASLTARALNRGTPRAKLTFGFTGKEIR